MSDQSRQKATVFVGGLDNSVNEQTLHDAFIPFGEIVDISIPKPELYAHPPLFLHANSPFFEMLMPQLPTHHLDHRQKTHTEASAMSNSH
jgi:hypothetical protein